MTVTIPIDVWLDYCGITNLISQFLSSIERKVHQNLEAYNIYMEYDYTSLRSIYMDDDQFWIYSLNSSSA
jgi:hypothetical protein